MRHQDLLPGANNDLAVLLPRRAVPGTIELVPLALLGGEAEPHGLANTELHRGRRFRGDRVVADQGEAGQSGYGENSDEVSAVCFDGFADGFCCRAPVRATTAENSSRLGRIPGVNPSLPPSAPSLVLPDA